MPAIKTLSVFCPCIGHSTKFFCACPEEKGRKIVLSVRDTLITEKHTERHVETFLG